MTAESLALGFSPAVDLGSAAVLEVMSAVLMSLRDPLDKVWIEDEDESRSAVSPEAEVFCLTENEKTLYFARPQVVEPQQSVPHQAVLEGLIRARIVPDYGFGYFRKYGQGPDYFANGRDHPVS
jgi:hypothetical protein